MPSSRALPDPKLMLPLPIRFGRPVSGAAAWRKDRTERRPLDALSGYQVVQPIRQNNERKSETLPIGASRNLNPYIAPGPRLSEDSQSEPSYYLNPS